jgi:hypothetical protein
LAFDLENDPDEQVDLLRQTPIESSPELLALRQAALADFSFDEVEKLRAKQSAELKRDYPARVSCKTPNQIARGDGRLVEADSPLYAPHIVSDDPERDFTR